MESTKIERRFVVHFPSFGIVREMRAEFLEIAIRDVYGDHFQIASMRRADRLNVEYVDVDGTFTIVERLDVSGHATKRYMGRVWMLLDDDGRSASALRDELRGLIACVDNVVETFSTNPFTRLPNAINELRGFADCIDLDQLIIDDPKSDAKSNDEKRVRVDLDDLNAHVANAFLPVDGRLTICPGFGTRGYVISHMDDGAAVSVHAIESEGHARESAMLAFDDDHVVRVDSTCVDDDGLRRRRVYVRDADSVLHEKTDELIFVDDAIQRIAERDDGKPIA